LAVTGIRKKAFYHTFARKTGMYFCLSKKTCQDFHFIKVISQIILLTIILQYRNGNINQYFLKKFLLANNSCTGEYIVIFTSVLTMYPG
jgi:hypothetical protein